MYIPTPEDFEDIPHGVHLMRCYQFIDMGTLKNNYQGETKIAHKVRMAFEACELFRRDGKPMVINQMYTFSFNSKATLRKHLEGMRGKPFDNKIDFGENGQFQPRKIVGVPCFVTVGPKETGEGSKIVSVTAITKSMNITPPPLVNTPLYLCLEKGEFEKKAFDALSEKTKDMIAESPEYKELFRSRNAPASNAGQQNRGVSYSGADDNDRFDAPPPDDWSGDGDDMPF